MCSTFVMTKKMQNTERFPFDDIELIPAPRFNPFRHGWLKFVERRPPIVYRGEYQLLANLLERRGADVMHIYFGHTGVHLLPFIQCWDKPCIVSFHGADVMLKADSPDYAAKLNKVFDAVPLVLARSRSLEQRLIRLGCDPEKIRINRTGIPLVQFPARRREAPGQKALAILAGVPFDSEKGPDDLLARLRSFLSPKSECRVAHRRERAVATCA